MVLWSPIRVALWLTPLAWLWFRLIDHLRVEWSVNPQYTYGWAVPFLCAYLLWGKAENRKQKAEVGDQRSEFRRRGGRTAEPALLGIGEGKDSLALAFRWLLRDDGLYPGEAPRL